MFVIRNQNSLLNLLGLLFFFQACTPQQCERDTCDNLPKPPAFVQEVIDGVENGDTIRFKNQYNEVFKFPRRLNKNITYINGKMSLGLPLTCEMSGEISTYDKNNIVISESRYTISIGDEYYNTSDKKYTPEKFWFIHNVYFQRYCNEYASIDCDTNKLISFSTSNGKIDNNNSQYTYIGDQYIQGKLYKDVYKAEPQYDTSVYKRPFIRHWFNHNNGLLRLEERYTNKIWEKI